MSWLKRLSTWQKRRESATAIGFFQVPGWKFQPLAAQEKMHVCYCQRFATRSFSGSFEMSSGMSNQVVLKTSYSRQGRSPSRASKVRMDVDQMSLDVHCIRIDWYRSVCLCNNMYLVCCIHINLIIYIRYMHKL